MLQRWMDSQAHSKIIATNSVHQKKIKVEAMRNQHTSKICSGDVLESRNLDKFQRERERGGRKFVPVRSPVTQTREGLINFRACPSDFLKAFPLSGVHLLI